MARLTSLILFATIAFFAGHGTSCSHTDELIQKYAALPPTSKGLDLGNRGYAVESFGSGAYMVTDGGYQSLFLVSDEGVIVVDAPPTNARGLQYAIGNTTHQPISHFIYSHHHSDHVGAAYLYINKDTGIIGHVDTHYQLSQISDPKRPLPTTTFQDDYCLRVGNQTLELSYKGPNHDDGNLFIYHPDSAVLMLVDVVYPGWIPFSSLGESTNIPGWILAHQQILSYDFTHYIGGHLGRSGNRTDVLIQQSYVSDLFTTCNATIHATASPSSDIGPTSLLGPVLQLNPGNSWAAFKAYVDIAAERCANVTNEKWLGVLGGADTFGFENAVKMIESLRIDYGELGPFVQS